MSEFADEMRYRVSPDTGDVFPLQHGPDIGIEDDLRLFETKHDYFEYSRNLGALDLYDLHSERSLPDMPLRLELVSERFPVPYIQHCVRTVMPSEEAISRFEAWHQIIDADFMRQASEQGASLDTWRSKFVDFFRGAVIIDVQEHEFWVPFFSARPPNLAGSKFQYDYSSKLERGIEFEIGVPGLGGGFGSRSGVSTAYLSVEDLNEEEQFQVKSVGLLLTKEDRFGQRKMTFAPREVTDTRIARVSDRSRFIPCKKTSPWKQMGHAHCHHASDRWLETKIERNSFDHFVFSPSIKGVSGSLKIDSILKTEFAVRHQLTSGYRYQRLRTGVRGHDIRVDAVSDP